MTSTLVIGHTTKKSAHTSVAAMEPNYKLQKVTLDFDNF